jgi:hypothetical protein
MWPFLHLNLFCPFPHKTSMQKEKPATSSMNKQHEYSIHVL